MTDAKIYPLTRPSIAIFWWACFVTFGGFATWTALSEDIAWAAPFALAAGWSSRNALLATGPLRLTTMSITKDRLVLRSWPRGLSVEWRNMTSLAFIPDGASLDLILQAHLTNGRIVSMRMRNWRTRAELRWPLLIEQAVDAHEIAITDESRHLLLTGFTHGDALRRLPLSEARLLVAETCGQEEMTSQAERPRLDTPGEPPSSPGPC
jgi:hypothetical protein